MRRIALFGGSFDPIHTDHVNIIKACRDDLHFDEVWIVPAFVNPFKNISTSSVAQRLAMIEMAIKDLPYARISQFEISKQKSSYTYDTILHFKRRYPDDQFTFIMGSDQLDNFESWNFFDELIAAIDFKIFKRSDQYNHAIATKYQLEVFDFENNYLSSTKIRNLESLDLQIKPVNDYINNNLMYLYERLETKMDEKRYYHSLNVGQMALELAQLNGVDLNKAMIAGTLHDVAKRWPVEKMRSYLAKYASDLLTEPEPIWHSFVGALHIKHDWLFDDEEIYSAIFKHTVGDKTMSPLDMIVFCADKISLERDYPGVQEFRTLVKADLRLGFKELLRNQVEVAAKKHGQDAIGSQIMTTYQHWIKEVEHE
jgi:nicotinate-nucleotide adenylyltransferase